MRKRIEKQLDDIRVTIDYDGREQTDDAAIRQLKNLLDKVQRSNLTNK